MANAKLVQTVEIVLGLSKEEGYFLLGAVQGVDGLQSVENSLRAALRQGSALPAEVSLSLECPKCGRVFTTKHGLGTHLAKAHKQPELVREGGNNGQGN